LHAHVQILLVSKQTDTFQQQNKKPFYVVNMLQ